MSHPEFFHAPSFDRISTALNFQLRNRRYAISTLYCVPTIIFIKFIKVLCKFVLLNSRFSTYREICTSVKPGTHLKD